MAGASLRHVDSEGINLSYAGSFGADLESGYFAHANMSHSNFQCANFEDANLIDADLSHSL